jgi:DNA-binding SARP family transcriptional activator
MTAVQIQLLGRFQLFYQGSLMNTIHQARQQSLLAYLLLHRHTPLTRQEVAFRFWPDLPEKQAFANLRKALHRLRLSLPDPDQFLQIDARTIDSGPGTVDPAA